MATTMTQSQVTTYNNLIVYGMPAGLALVGGLGGLAIAKKMNKSTMLFAGIGAVAGILIGYALRTPVGNAVFAHGGAGDTLSGQHEAGDIVNDGSNTGTSVAHKNFSGVTGRPTVVGNNFQCPSGTKWSGAERKCVAGGFM
ncbi:MAG TPA: hypothetical protein VN026_13600 [Bacteroidia bacterium]|jgi:hypothetical protein|nr:hypothetical protein [Bacteroidia bacterium]